MNAEINVTSLVDVAFTLLVIFIITAPILQGGIEVDIPRADVQPLSADDAPFFITIMRDGQVFLEDTPVQFEDFETTLTQVLAGGAIERIFIRGDSLAQWGRVLNTMATTVNSGIPWSVVAEPYVPNR